MPSDVAKSRRWCEVLCDSRNLSEFEFKCMSCREIHTGIPAFGADYPITVLDVPEEEREAWVDLGSDDCVIDEKGVLC